jgi:CBS domain containing-hemolysin-like protein
MALVSNHPGGPGGALGVITLEDVIEELIGEVSLSWFILISNKY